MRRYGHRADGGEEEEMAVRLGAGDIFRPDRAVGSGLVLDNDALAQAA